MPKKRGRGRPKTGAQQWFLVRLPLPYKAALDAARAASKRSYAAEVRVALDAHLKLVGVAPPTA